MKRLCSSCKLQAQVNNHQRNILMSLNQFNNNTLPNIFLQSFSKTTKKQSLATAHQWTINNCPAAASPDIIPATRLRRFGKRENRDASVASRCSAELSPREHSRASNREPKQRVPGNWLSVRRLWRGLYRITGHLTVASYMYRIKRQPARGRSAARNRAKNIVEILVLLRYMMGEEKCCNERNAGHGLLWDGVLLSIFKVWFGKFDTACVVTFVSRIIFTVDISVVFTAKVTNCYSNVSPCTKPTSRVSLENINGWF